jgi:hypothetical protein
LLGTYWSQGDLAGRLALTVAAGLSLLESRSSLGEAVFPTAAAVADTEIRATPLGGRIAPETYALIVSETVELLDEYADGSGLVRVPIRATLLAARKD